MNLVNVLKRHWLGFCKIAIAYFLFFTTIRYLKDLGYLTWFERFSTDAYLGLLATAVTYAFSLVSDRAQKRNQLILEGQRANQLMIEENYADTVKSIQKLEASIDEVRALLNILEVLEARDVDHNHKIGDLMIKFADLDQRQTIGDRLAPFADAIAKCLTQQERILIIQEMITKNSTGGKNLEQ
jgi:hypothetical protein